MAFHTKRSPSKAKQFIECAGSLAISNSIPEDQRPGSGPAAKLGTATHALIEECLERGTEPADYEDRIIELIDDGDGGAKLLKANAKTPRSRDSFFMVDEEMIANATLMTDYVRGRCEELGIDPEVHVPAGEAGNGLQLESRTNPLPERDDTSGTADVTMASDEVLEVVDYKNGWITVEHEGNKQTMAYLLGKAIEHKFRQELYRVTIVQPRAEHSEGHTRSDDFTAAELKAFQKSYRAGIGKCERAEAAFEDFGQSRDGSISDDWAESWLKAGDHCTFCDAQAICPARRKLAEDAAKVDFAEEPEEVDIHVPTKYEPKPARTVDQRAFDIVYWAPQLEALIKAAKIYAQRALEAGFDDPRFKLVARRSIRRLKDGVTIKELAASGFFKAGDVKAGKLKTTPKLLSGPQLEKLVDRKQRKKFNARFLDKPDNGLTIALATDSRPAIEHSPGDDFADDLPADEFDFG